MAPSVDVVLQRAHALRRHFAVGLGSMFAGRQDSCVHLRLADFGVGDTHMWLRVTEKGKRGLALRRVIRIPLDAPPSDGHPSILPELAALARRYLAARRRAYASAGGAQSEWLFQLPRERRPTTRSMESWVADLLSHLHVVAPDGFVYQGHSIRSGAVSAMAALGIPRHLYV